MENSAGDKLLPPKAKKGGRISGNARRALEKQTGKKVVSGQNFLPKRDIKKLA
jgi:hypothetical protein